MTGVTRCPACRTAFRVTPAQLGAHGGRVRCGRCDTVFDAWTFLAVLPEAKAPDAAEPPEPPPTALPRDMPADVRDAGPAPGEAASSETEARTADSFPLDPLPEPIVRSPEPLLPAAEKSKTPPASLHAESAPEAEWTLPGIADPAGLGGPRSAGADAPTWILPDLVPPAPSSASRRLPVRRWPWTLAALAALAALIAQGAYWYRSELVARFPEARPALEGLCELLACGLTLPERLDAVTIEASDLQAPDPARPNLVYFTATLRNHADTPVAYPAVDLLLLSSREQTLARRLFAPGEYLAGRANPAAGIPPNGEVAVKLTLDFADLPAAGYRLHLVYP